MDPVLAHAPLAGYTPQERELLAQIARYHRGSHPKKKHAASPTFGVVPFGTPLIAGPATLTTTLVLVGSYGYTPVILSLVANILLAWLIFAQAERIIKFMGIGGTRAFAKVAALLLAAFAVKLIRSGMFKLVEG